VSRFRHAGLGVGLGLDTEAEKFYKLCGLKMTLTPLASRVTETVQNVYY